MKKRTKITAENAAAIAAILAAAQTGRAQNDLSVQNIINLATNAEKRLARAMVPLAKRSKARFEYEAGGAEVKAYKYPIATKNVVIERGTKDWFLISVCASSKFPLAPVTRRMTLSDEQIEIIKSKAVHYVETGKAA